MFSSWLEYQSFPNSTPFYHLNTRQVQYSDSHYVYFFLDWRLRRKFGSQLELTPRINRWSWLKPGPSSNSRTIQREGRRTSSHFWSRGGTWVASRAWVELKHDWFSERRIGRTRPIDWDDYSFGSWSTGWTWGGGCTCGWSPTCWAPDNAGRCWETDCSISTWIKVNKIIFFPWNW